MIKGILKYTSDSFLICLKLLQHSHQNENQSLSNHPCLKFQDLLKHILMTFFPKKQKL